MRDAETSCTLSTIKKTGTAENFGPGKRYRYVNDFGPDVVSCDDKRERLVIPYIYCNVNIHTCTRAKKSHVRSRTMATFVAFSSS